MTNWTNNVDFVGPPSDVIQQASSSKLESLLTKVNNHVYEFTAQDPDGPNELATGWRHNEQYLVTNAHAVVALLSGESVDEGSYVAQPLKTFEGFQSLTLRLIDRDNDLAGLLFEENSNQFGLHFRETEPEVGEEAIIVGRTQGTNTKGVLDGKIKKKFEDVFLYDAPTKPGSSGSPILDIDGKVIGVHQGVTPEDGNYNGWAIGILNTRARPLLERKFDVTRDGDGSEEGLITQEKLTYISLGLGGLVALKTLGE